MPERIQFYLNIDFPERGERDAGWPCRAEKTAGQKMPVLGKYCRVDGKYFHFVSNIPEEKSPKTKKKGGARAPPLLLISKAYRNKDRMVCGDWFAIARA
jgi:hypothetical protein